MQNFTPVCYNNSGIIALTASKAFPIFTSKIISYFKNEDKKNLYFS